MSDYRTLDQIAVDTNSCTTCGARPGEFCRTASGRPADAHEPRMWPVREGYAAGCEEASNR